MILNSLVIDNFRCFKHYEIEFAPGTTVLIGKNGTGKSSLIHAIHYALSFIFTNDNSMGNDFLSAGNPDLKVISPSPFDFYKDKEQGTVQRNFGYYHWDEETACTSIWEQRFINALIKHNNLGNKDLRTKVEVNFIKNKLRDFSKPISERQDADFEIDELHYTSDFTLYARLTNGKDMAFVNLPAGYRRLYAIVLDIAQRKLEQLKMIVKDYPDKDVFIRNIEESLN